MLSVIVYKTVWSTYSCLRLSIVQWLAIDHVWRVLIGFFFQKSIWPWPRLRRFFTQKMLVSFCFCWFYFFNFGGCLCGYCWFLKCIYLWPLFFLIYYLMSSALYITPIFPHYLDLPLMIIYGLRPLSKHNIPADHFNATGRLPPFKVVKSVHIFKIIFQHKLKSFFF